MATVQLNDICKRYGDVSILKRVDLQIQDGEFLTLVGPSGCGKSTLLRIIAGLEAQNSGQVAIGSEVVDQVSPSDRNLSMVFQSYALYPHLTVKENIAVPLRMRWLNFWQRLPVFGRFLPGTSETRNRIEQRVTESVESLGLQGMLDRKPGQLSGGQRQRVAVGRALVRHPEAFLLDEPLSNLDAKLRVHMRAEITQLHRKLRATFIYVTHDQSEAMTMSDRIAVMMQGELIQVGTPDEVYHDPKDLRVAEFIGSPKINVISASVNPSGQIELFSRETDLIVPEHLKSNNVSLALRPEHLFLANKERIDSFKVTVDLVENLGSEVFVHACIETSGEPVVLKLSSESASGLRAGHALWLGFDPARALLFDASGKRIQPTRINAVQSEVSNA